VWPELFPFETVVSLLVATSECVSDENGPYAITTCMREGERGALHIMR
jgi:hypothetical protein